MAKTAQNPCTGETVVSAFAAILEAKGIRLHNVGTMDFMGVEGQAQYQTTKNRIATETLDTTSDNPDDENTVKTLANKTNENILQAIINNQRHPSGILGEEFVKPILDFSRDFHATHWKNLGPVRGQYSKGMKAVLGRLDTSKLNDAQKAYLARWSNELMDGGSLYPRSPRKTGIGQALSNFVENTIHSSSHVLGGHFISSSIKLASLYPDTMVQGLAKAISKNPFKELPELAELGLYGRQMEFDEAPKSALMKQWNGLVNLIDTPVANISYFAGEARGGKEEGLKAAQRLAFKFRLNDIPEQMWTQDGRTQARYLGWTINSGRLYASLWVNPFLPGKTVAQRATAVSSLAAFHVLPFMLGGAAAANQGKDFMWGGANAVLPGPLKWVASLLSPEADQAFKDNNTGMAESLSIRDMSGVGIATEAWNKKTFMDAPKAMKEAAYYARNGEPGFALLEAGTAGLSLAKSFKGGGIVGGILNDGMTLKAYNIMKKQIEGTNTEEFGDAMMHLAFPASE